MYFSEVCSEMRVTDWWCRRSGYLKKSSGKVLWLWFCVELSQWRLNKWEPFSELNLSLSLWFHGIVFSFARTFLGLLNLLWQTSGLFSHARFHLEHCVSLHNDWMNVRDVWQSSWRGDGIMGHGGSLVDSTPIVRRGVSSNPALAAM